MEKRKYFNNLAICIFFYTLVCIMVIYRSDLTLSESSILIAYSMASSLLFPFVVDWMESINKKPITATAWYCGIFTLCLILSIPAGLILLIRILYKRWQ